MCTVYEEIHRIGIIPVAKLDKPEEDSVPVAGGTPGRRDPVDRSYFSGRWSPHGNKENETGGAQLYGGRGDSPDR